MSDNPVVQGATVPIPVRAEDVLGTGAETQWVRIDLGGTGVELRLTAGQKDSAHSVPVVLSSDQVAALITALAPSAGLIQNALLNADPWNPKGVYNGGDSCVWNGQVYQCIVGTGTNYPYPTNGTYWQLDQRPNKSLVAQGKTSPPGASRLRVEQEDSQYLTRMAEQQLIYSQILAQNALLFEEHLMSRVDTAAGGRPSAAGQNNSYLMEEIR